jgi:hypothetical protein
MLVLVANLHELERFRLLTDSGGPLAVQLIESPLTPYTPLVFTVSDDDGIVAPTSSSTRLVAAAGTRLATDKVIGVYSNSLAVGSGLVVLGAIPADDFIQLTYDNGTSGATTNGLTTYTVFVARFPP